MTRGIVFFSRFLQVVGIQENLCSTWQVQAQGACLVQSHLHGKALIVYVGHSRSIHIQQDKATMVCDDAAPLVVNLV